MAPSSSQPSGSGHAPSRNICRYFPGGEHKRTTDFSPRRSKRPILRPTPTGSRSRRGSPVPSFLFRIFPWRRVPCPLPPGSSSSSYIRFLYPPVGTARVLQDFQFWQMARAEQKDQFPPLSSHLLRRSFVEPRPMKLLARDKLVNSKRSSPISLKRNGTFHDRHGTKRSFLSIRI